MSEVKSIYDYTKIYREEIYPHVKEIVRICRQYHIPVFFTIPIKNSEDETKYETEIRTPGSEGISLHQDDIRKIILVRAELDNLTQDVPQNNYVVL